MLLYRICNRSEIERKRLLILNKYDFKQDRIDNYGEVLKFVGKHVTKDCYKHNDKKPFKSFSKCPILLYSHLHRNKLPWNLNELSLIAIKVDSEELDTLDCLEMDFLQLQEVKLTEQLKDLQLTRVCVDLTNKEQNNILKIPLEGIRSKYGASRAEVVIYDEKPREIILELPASFFIEVFDALSLNISSSMEFKTRQQYIASAVWKNSGIDKRRNTDRFIRKLEYEKEVITLINDCTKDMPQRKSTTCNHTPQVCPVFGYLTEYRNYKDVTDQKTINHPAFQDKVKSVKANLGTDWCRGWKCRKYYTPRNV